MSRRFATMSSRLWVRGLSVPSPIETASGSSRISRPRAWPRARWARHGKSFAWSSKKRSALRPSSATRSTGSACPGGPRQEMIFLTAEQVFDLSDAIANPPRPPRHQLKTWPAFGLPVRFAAFTGLRAGEIGALRVGRVGPDRGWVEAAETAEEVHGRLLYGPPKTYSRRRVELPTGLARDLANTLRPVRPRKTHSSSRPPQVDPCDTRSSTRAFTSRRWSGPGLTLNPVP